MDPNKVISDAMMVRYKAIVALLVDRIEARMFSPGLADPSERGALKDLPNVGPVPRRDVLAVGFQTGKRLLRQLGALAIVLRNCLQIVRFSSWMMFFFSSCSISPTKELHSQAGQADD